MFDLSFSEILVVGVVVLLVVRPEDLPGLMRTIGNVFGKIRGFAHEFGDLMHEISDAAGVNEIKKDLTQIKDLEGNLRDAYDVKEIKELLPPSKEDTIH